MTPAQPRPRPPSAIDDFDHIRKRVDQIRLEEDRKPHDPFAPPKPTWPQSMTGCDTEVWIDV